METKAETKEKSIFRLSSKGLAWYTLPLPIIAFLSCIILSLIFDFKASTRTHCKVPNYLPSISAAIAGHTPQRYIWKICIALHSAPRLMLAIAYHNFYMTFSVRNQSLYSRISKINSTFHILENLCLVGLSYISSQENFTVHKFSFVGFVIFSQLYMIISLVLFSWGNSQSGWSERALRSFRWKLTLAVVNIGSFILALYFYWRHNTYCEPGVFTYFAACEYLMICSNIAYHGYLCYYDIDHYELLVLPLSRTASYVYTQRYTDTDLKLSID